MSLHHERPMRISVIITVYNWPEALHQVLRGLMWQERPPDEVLVADDGSTENTRALIEFWQPQLPWPLTHVWQEDEGFRAAAIRNQAAAYAQGDYLVFLDGDCIPCTDTLLQHERLAQKGCFVSGNRVLLQPERTQQILEEGWTPPTRQEWWQWYRQGHINRWLPTLRLPLGPLRHWGRHAWQGAKTCNMGIWRNDFIQVNGFEESFQGWGYEDSELAQRLINNSIQHKWGRLAATVVHLWHPEAKRSREETNWAALMDTKRARKKRAEHGVGAYL